MALETDLQKMARHLVDVLESNQESILDSNSEMAFAKVDYGQARVIRKWPYLSVEPQVKTREIKGTRKFDIEFVIWVVLYHGKVADTLGVQEETHQRAEVVENYLNDDQKWNFIDSTDSSKDKVIFGHVSVVDHPTVVAPEEELWSASRLTLTARSEEFF